MKVCYLAKLLWTVGVAWYSACTPCEVLCNLHVRAVITASRDADYDDACVQAAPVSAWQMKLGIRRELGLYADSIANYGALITNFPC